MKIGIDTPRTAAICFRRTVLSTLAVLALITGAAACGGDDDSSGEQSSATLTVGAELTAPAVMLDPAQRNSLREAPSWMNLIYDVVIGRDENGQPVPTGLAQEFSFPDPRTIELTFHEGVTFHDGTPLNAEAVKFSFDRAKASYDAGEAVTSGSFAVLESTEVVSEYVVHMNLSEPVTAIFMFLLQDADLLGVVSPAAVEEYGAKYADNPVGAGPYMLDDLKPEQLVSLVPNPDYWNEDSSPNLSRIDFVNTPHGVPRLTALQSGDIDLAIYNPEDVATLQLDDSLTVVEGLPDPFTAQTWSLYMCIAEPPFDADAVRHGVQRGLNREVINDAVFGGTGTPTVVPLPPSSPYHSAEVAESASYDLEEARRLVADGDGEGASITLMYRPIETRVAEVIQQQLQDLGFDVTLQLTNDIVGDLARDKPEMFLSSPAVVHIPSYATADGAVNPCGWDNAEFQEVLAATNDLSQSDVELIDAWERYQEIWLDEAVVVSMLMTPKLIIHADHVENIPPPVQLTVDLREVVVTG